MDGGTVFALVASTMFLVFLAVVVGLAVLAFQVVSRRTSGWVDTARRRGWQHADVDALAVGERLGGSVSRTLWASLNTSKGPVTVGVVSLAPHLEGGLVRTTLRSPYAAPVGVALVDLAPPEAARLDDGVPAGMVVSHHQGLVVVRPRTRLRLQGTPPSPQEAEAVLDAVAAVVQRARPR